MRKNIEDALRSILSSEQVAALKEEIASGMKKINSAVESNEKVKAKKELLLESFAKVDKLIETSHKTPLLLKTFYSATKTNIRKFLEPVIEKMMEEEEISNLDDIPDVPEEKKPEEKKPEKKEPKPQKKQMKKTTETVASAKNNKPSANHRKRSDKPKPTGK